MLQAPAVTKEEREMDKSLRTARGRLCRMLGYAEDGKNTYIVLDIISRKVLDRDRCYFYENVELEFLCRLLMYYED